MRVRILATYCPTCGFSENGLITIRAESLRRPWFCVDCKPLRKDETTRLMFEVEAA